MRAHSTLKLLAVAVVLTVYWVVFERESFGPEANVGRVFPDLLAADIEEVEITRTSRPGDAALGLDSRPIKLRHERSPPAWWIVEPIRFEALYPRAQGIAHSLADVIRIAEAPADSTALAGGVEVVVRFRTRRGEERVLEIGGEHPDMDLDFSYARTGGEVFVTRKEFRKNFLVTLTEMRSRALFPVAVPDAAGFSVEGDPAFAKTVAWEAPAGTWRLQEPIDALADRELTEELLGRLNEWKVSEFVKDDALRPEDLAPFGLDSPRAVITVRARDGRTIALHAGADQGEGAVYVRHAGQPHVFTAPRETLEKALEGPESFRSRFLLELGLDEIDRIRAEGDGKEIVLERLEVAAAPPRPTAPPGAGPGSSPGAGSVGRHAWRVREAPGNGEGKSFPGDRRIIDGLAATLKRTLILKFLPRVDETAVGLDPPRWKVAVGTSGGKTLEVRIGKASDAPEDAGLDIHHVTVPREPGAFQVKTELPGLLEEGSHAFRDRQVSRLDPEAVLEIEITVAGTEPYALVRTRPGEPWMLQVDARTPLTGAMELDPRKVNQLLGLLGESFRAIRFLPEITSYAERGLELQSPRRAISIVRIEGEPSGVFRKLVLGDAVEGSAGPEVLARMDLPDLPPFSVPDSLSRLFDDLAAHLRAARGR
jgi:hypothetical protein